MSDIAIQVEKLGKRYRIGAAHERPDTLRDALMGFVRRQSHDTAKTDYWALRDVSFEVERGEVIGVIGRNGAGKSTLLKILSRITEPTEGRAVLHGRVGSLLEVGTGFHPELTGRENVYLSGAILGMHRAEIDRQFDEIIAFAEIAKFLDTPVKRYSSGMYVRLAFAVAAHLNPEILLVDEVLAVGDAQFQKKCLGKMSEVANQGRTVLFVSHNMAAISELCSKVLLLSTGQVEAHGDARNVIAQFTADLFAPRGVDMEPLRVPGFGSRIRFSEIELLSGENGRVPFASPVCFGLTITSSVDAGGLSIGASVLDEGGQSVGNHFTEPEIRVEQAGSVYVELRLDAPVLAPGRYYMGFSIGRGGLHGARQDQDRVVGKPGFVIETVSDDNEYVDWNPRWGRVVIDQVTMNITPLQSGQGAPSQEGEVSTCHG